MKKYQIIYADPPWRYEFANGYNRAIENHYPTMSLDEIKAMQIPTTDNSMLYLWATAPKLGEAMQVIDAWGFNYRSCFVWDKLKMGCGNYCRIQHELLLIARKGKFSCPATSQRIRSIYAEERTKHSRKPVFFRNWIADSYPQSTKLELFARKPDLLFDAEGYDGWDVWGNEVDSDIEL